MRENPTTGRLYRGGNAIHLLATGLQRDYDDPRLDELNDQLRELMRYRGDLSKFVTAALSRELRTVDLLPIKLGRDAEALNAVISAKLVTTSSWPPDNAHAYALAEVRGLVRLRFHRARFLELTQNVQNSLRPR